MKKRFFQLPMLAAALLFTTACAQVVAEQRPLNMYGYGVHDQAREVVRIENEYLILEFLTDTAEIIVTQRATGAVWRSNPEGAAQADDVGIVARALMQSQFSLQFEDSTGAGMTMDSFRFSVEDGLFEHNIVDGGLEISYTVGDIPQVFIIPLAVPESRMEEFLDRMDTQTRRMVVDTYRLYDIDRLRPSDDRAELLSLFPSLENERMFVLRDATPDFLRERLEVIFYDVGYTIQDFEDDIARYSPRATAEGPAFNITIRYELDGSDLVVSVPFDRISYRLDFPITRFTLLPFFGAGGMQDEGYIFVPDGNGALITFNNGRHSQLVYSNNVFGWDEAIVRDAIVHDSAALFPVFGVHKNGNSFAAIIEEGAAYATIRSEVSGMSSTYNNVSANFRMIHGSSLQIAGRSDRPILIHELGLPEGESIVVRYVFPETPGYVGMAIAYREFLQARYPWLNNRLESNVTAAVEILGAVSATQHVLGFPVERPLRLTSYRDAANMMRNFSDLGWENVHVKMRGAFNDSIDHSVPSSINLISELGGRRDFNYMVSTANELGFEFFLEGDFVHMRDISMFDGFSVNQHAARQVNRERAQTFGHSHVFFGELTPTSGNLSTLARPEVTARLISDFAYSASRIGVNNIAFRTIGSSLAGDFHERRHVSREASKNMRVDTLSNLRDQGVGIWINHGFSYTIPFADIITSMPVSDQDFGITDTSVPFLQIALHGIVPFTGRPVNLAENYSYNLLRSIESGSGLFFSFMAEPTSTLQETRYRRYFANEYDRWIGVANDMHQMFQENFGHLYNQLIVDHRILDRGVTVTVYEDGTQVFVNISEEDFVSGGVSVPANRFTVVR